MPRLNSINNRPKILATATGRNATSMLSTNLRMNNPNAKTTLWAALNRRNTRRGGT